MKYQLPDGNVIIADQAFVDLHYPGATLAPEAAIPEPQAVSRHITVGAFFDRFGAAKWAILADTTPTVQAVIKDASVRKYIDLDNPELAGGIALLQQAGHQVDAEAVIDAPVQPGERA